MSSAKKTQLPDKKPQEKKAPKQKKEPAPKKPEVQPAAQPAVQPAVQPGKKKAPSQRKKAPGKEEGGESKKVKEPLSSEEKKTRSPRKRVTIETYLEKLDKLLLILDGEVEKKDKETGTRIFRSIRKTVRELKTEAPKLTSTKRKVASGDNKRTSGLELQCKISNELADFMELKRGSTPSRKDITNAICAYIHLKPDETRKQVLAWSHLNPSGKRNLQNPENKMKIVPDDKLSSLLRLGEYQKSVKEGKVKETVLNIKTRKREVVTVHDPSVKYYVVQRLIKPHIIETFKSSKEEE